MWGGLYIIILIGPYLVELFQQNLSPTHLLYHRHLRETTWCWPKIPPPPAWSVTWRCQGPSDDLSIPLSSPQPIRR